MSDLQWFILAILFLIFLAGVHRRTVRYLLVKKLLKDNMDSDEIAEVLNAYRGEDQ